MTSTGSLKRNTHETSGNAFVIWKTEGQAEKCERDVAAAMSITVKAKDRVRVVGNRHQLKVSMFLFYRCRFGCVQRFFTNLIQALHPHTHKHKQLTNTLDRRRLWVLLTPPHPPTPSLTIYVVNPYRAEGRGVLKLEEQVGVARHGRSHQGQNVAQHQRSLLRGAGRAAARRVFGEGVLTDDKVGRHVRQHVRYQGGPRPGLVVDEAAGLEELVRVLADVGLENRTPRRWQAFSGRGSF